MPESSGIKYVGRRIALDLDGEIFEGTISRFNASSCHWNIIFDNGVAEEMDHVDLLLAMDLFQGNSDRSYIGLRVSRKFGSKICDGTIDRFDSRRRLWRIAFDYGDVGEVVEMDHRELLYAIDLFEGKEDEEPTESTNLQVHPSYCAKRKKYQNDDDDDDVQLFFFNCEDLIVKQEHGPERPRRKLKAVKRFDPSSYDPQAHCPIGHGFACPRCSEICSYDSRECEECHLECCWQAGVGVVELKERKVVKQRKNHAGRAEIPVKHSSNDAYTPRKSVEDVTEIYLAMKEEQHQKMRDEAMLL